MTIVEALVEEGHLLEPARGVSKFQVVVSKISSSGQKVIVVPVSSVGSPLVSSVTGRLCEIGLAPLVTVTLDHRLQAGRQRVDDGDAHAVETTGDGVGLAVELAPAWSMVRTISRVGLFSTG